MRSVVVRGVVSVLLSAAMGGPSLAGSPQYKDVCASGCTYSSVQAAITSITDSSATKVYTVFIDSGVLQSDDSITTSGKDYINFVGRGMGVSVLQASSNWYSRVASLSTPPDFFDFTGSTNCTVSNLTIDARTTDPGNVSTAMQLAGAKVDPGTGGKITFDGVEVQGIQFGMWDDGTLSDGTVEIFDSKLRAAQYAGYVSNDKWHIFSSELRAVDNGGTSGTIAEVAGLLVYTAEATLWGSHVHAESAQANKTYAVSGITVSTASTPVITVIGSTLHVKMTTASVGSAARQMVGAFMTFGQGNFVGTEFLYESPASLSQGKLAGLRLGASATTVNLAGCTFRDAGGSGATRSDILVANSSSNPVLRVAGTRIASAATITGTALHASVIKAISAIASQRGSSTFAGSSSVAVTLPVALPDTSYSVGVSGNAGETFWVTGKSTSGFTLRSSNATSTATVDWSVTGCNFGSSSCGF
jgi:hypothetical protein